MSDGHDHGSRPLREEQQTASEEILEVAPGILRLQLPIEFTGLGHVNTYALEDGDGFAVVDPGLPGKKSWEDLQGRLAAAEIPLARVHTVIVTHSHPDHFGGAGLLAEESGARIVASDRFSTWWDPQDLDDRELETADDAADEETESGTEDDEQKLPPSPFGQPTPWGGKTEELTPERRKEIEENIAEAMQWFRAPRPSLRLADEDPIVLGGREWFGLYTPGHTADHLCLYDPTEGVLLAGDHVLPTITPHISGLVQEDPLARYVDSLDRVADLEGVKLVLPAHGQPFTRLTERVDEIKEHHDERLETLRSISHELGWATVVDLSHKLFAERSWGPMAESETYAHLEHLRLRNEADQREVAGMLEYLVP